MDKKEWQKKTRGEWVVDHKDGDVRFEILFDRDPDDNTLRVTDVAKFIGGMCVIVSDEEVDANREYYTEIVEVDYAEEMAYEETSVPAWEDIRGGCCDR
jgi:hypothetical protein